VSPDCGCVVVSEGAVVDVEESVVAGPVVEGVAGVVPAAGGVVAVVAAGPVLPVVLGMALEDVVDDDTSPGAVIGVVVLVAVVVVVSPVSATTGVTVRVTSARHADPTATSSARGRPRGTSTKA